MDQISGLVFLFLTVGLGYLMAAAKLIDRSASEVLPQLLFNLCYPAMILQTFTSLDTAVLLSSGLPVVAATVALTLILFFGTLVLFRRRAPSQRGIYTFLAGIGNVTFVAIPLFQVFLPPEAVMVAILHSAAQDPLIWGIYNPLLMSSQSPQHRSLRAILTSPCLLATFVGLVMVLLGITFPPLLQGTVSTFSSLTAPLGLLLIGMLIHRYGPLSWLKDRTAICYGVIRIFLYPLVIGVILLPFLSRTDTFLLAILFASPTPLMAVAWSLRAQRHTEFTVHCFLCSTLLYLAVMTPLLAFAAPWI